MEPTPFYIKARCLILGCGNTLFADDGFGCVVAQRLETAGMPEGVAVMDAGTGVRKILFNLLLSELRPSLVIVVDAVDCAHLPGDLFWIDLDQVPAVKTDDFSMHQAPTSNLLRELRDDCGVKIEVLACQSKHIPREMESGLSLEVEAAVQIACRMLIGRVKEHLDAAARGPGP